MPLFARAKSSLARASAKAGLVRSSWKARSSKPLWGDTRVIPLCHPYGAFLLSARFRTVKTVGCPLSSRRDSARLRTLQGFERLTEQTASNFFSLILLAFSWHSTACKNHSFPFELEQLERSHEATQKSGATDNNPSPRFFVY